MVAAQEPFELVIFDCDGVLVDSEELGTRALLASAAEIGVTLPLEEAAERFRGAKMADCVAVIEERLGRPTPSDFVAQVRRRMAEAFTSELRPVAGVEAALARIDLVKCVASSGPREKIRLSLSVTGLVDYFQDRIFSSYDIDSWKPDPDIFLHAARTLGVSPSQAAVVEDSAMGVRAGIAAGMRVFGFASGKRGAELAAEGARVFDHMVLLPGLLGCAPHRGQ
jgi:HAD superfamily hydrolase (TIGR01509 family)